MIIATPCPIWGTSASFSNPSGDYKVVDSARAGGRYKITGSAETLVATLSVREKATLTTLLIESRSQGESCPLLGIDLADRIKSKKDMSFSERIDAFFKWLNQRRYRPGDFISVLDGSHQNFERDSNELMAYTEMFESGEVKPFIAVLKEMSLLDTLSNHLTILKSKGYERLAQISSVNEDLWQAFVAMWFHDTMKDAYWSGIASAITDSGYKPLRIDQKEHSNKIDDEIISEIRRSRFLIADFTSGFVAEGEGSTLIARGGVYYEAGFAQGLGIPVIWTCREDCLRHIHFDTRQYAHIVWKGPDDLKEQLTKRIGAVIGWGPKIGG